MMTRCFLAFELTEESRKYLESRVSPFFSRLKEEMGWPVRLIRPENWHITLLFFEGLQDAERHQVWSEVENRISEISGDHLRFCWRGLSIWPSPRKPSLICLEADQTTINLNWGIPISGPPFSKGQVGHFLDYRPHSTLIRFRGRQSSLAGDWAALKSDLPIIEPEKIRVDGLSLFLSTLSRDQPIYPREFTTRPVWH